MRAGAEAAGRDPDAVKVVATVVTAPDLTEEQELAVVGGRAVTYYQIPEFGELLAGVNGWDPAGLGRCGRTRCWPTCAARPTTSSRRTSWPTSAVRCPRSGCTEGAAIGSAGVCADRLREYLAAGADEILIHGAVPDLLGPTLQHFRAA